MSEQTAERTWLEVGSEYTTTVVDRERVSAAIENAAWKEVPRNGHMSLPFSPGSALERMIREFQLPKITKVSHSEALRYPDGPETATYGLLGVEYDNGRSRIYALDTGGSLVPLVSDFFEI